MISTLVFHTPVNKRQKGSVYKFDSHYEMCVKAARIRADKKGGYAQDEKQKPKRGRER